MADSKMKVPTWLLVMVIFAILIGVIPNAVWLYQYGKKRWELAKAKKAAENEAKAAA